VLFVSFFHDSRERKFEFTWENGPNCFFLPVWAGIPTIGNILAFLGLLFQGVIHCFLFILEVLLRRFFAVLSLFIMGFWG